MDENGSCAIPSFENGSDKEVLSECNLKTVSDVKTTTSPADYQRMSTSVTSSNNSISIKERLKRVREEEKLKQQKRYEAYVETQRQYEMVRQRQQEERKRKMEELQEKKRIRHNSVIERLSAIEQVNQARIEKLRERSAHRASTSASGSKRNVNATTGFGRLGPNNLMTTSCVVAFGSSVPRSTCLDRSTSSNSCGTASDKDGPPTARVRKNSQSNDLISPPTRMSVFDRLTANVMTRSATNESDQPKSKKLNAPNKKVVESKSTKLAPKPRRPETAMTKSMYSGSPEPRKIRTSVVSGKIETSSLSDSTESIGSNSINSTGLASNLSNCVASGSELEKSEASSKVESVVSTKTALCAPIKAETHGSGEGGVLSESEAAIYRAKLVEQRRLAKERKEQEQRRLEEENRRRRAEQEEARLAAEEAIREQQKQAAADLERIQQQKELEIMAQVQAAEAERIAKMHRAEEERVIRRKKLDSIMSRVKSTHIERFFDDSQILSSVEAIAPDSTSSLICEEAEIGDVQVIDTHLDDTSVVSTSDLITSDAELNTTAQFDTPSALESVDFIANVDNVSTECVPESNSEVINPLKELECAENNFDSTELNGSLDQQISFDNSVSGVDHDTCEVVNNSPEVQNNSVDDEQSAVLSGSDGGGSGNSSPVRFSLLTNGSANAKVSATPRFKSSLLQSMLGGGRLSTRATDAIAEFRRGSLMQSSENVSKLPTDSHSSNGIMATLKENDSVMRTGGSSLCSTEYHQVEESQNHWTPTPKETDISQSDS